MKGDLPKSDGATKASQPSKVSQDVETRHGDSSPSTNTRTAGAVTELLARLDAASNDSPVKLGRYTVTGRIGAGGLGVVYHAISDERGQPTAIKTLPSLDPGALLRLKQEFRVVGDISHRNLVTLYELVSDGDAWYFAMEYIDGVNFIRHVRGSETPTVDRPEHDSVGPGTVTQTAGEGRLVSKPRRHELAVPADSRSGGSVPATLDVLRGALKQLVAGVRALHARGLLHLDLKPGNVLVTHDRRVVVLDFGLVVHKRETAMVGPTGQSLVGTPAYMAPEQACGDPISEASDWYAVGVMLYRALTGVLPFEGPMIKVLAKKVSTVPPAPNQVANGVPDDLNDLCMALLKIEPTERPTGKALETLVGSSPTADAPGASVGFVGRKSSLRVLHTAAESAATGNTVAVHISGESGMGKSRLIQHFLRELTRDNRDCVVLAGRCYERESVPYKAFDSLVDSLSAYLQGLDRETVVGVTPRYVHELMRIFPVLMSVNAFAAIPQRGVETVDLREVRRRAFRGLRELLARVGQRRRLVVHIDDIQWGDRDSVRLLGELLAPPDSPMMMLVLSFRSEALTGNQVIAELQANQAGAAHLDFYEVKIGPLSRAESIRVAAGILVDHPHAAELAERAARDSQGSPLMVEELAHSAAQHSSDGSERDSLSAGSVEMLVLKRLDRLEPGLQRLLKIIALAGNPLPQQVVVEAAGYDGDVYAAMGELRQSHLIRTTGARAMDAVETYHDSIRETVCKAVGQAESQELHQQLVGALAKQSGVDPELMARHYLGAEDLPKAAEFLLEAGRAAAAKLAFDQAAELIGQHLETLSASGGKPSTEARRQYASCLSDAGRCIESAKVYRSLAETAGSRSERLKLLQLAVDQYLKGSAHADAMDVIGPLFSELKLPLPKTSRRATYAAIWTIIRLKIRGIKFIPRESDAVPFEDTLRLEVLESVGKGLGNMDPIQGAVCMLRGLLLALKHGDQSRVATGLAHYGILLAYSGKPKAYAEAGEIMFQAKELADRIGDPRIRAYTRLGLGVAKIAIGEWRTGVEKLKESEELCDQSLVSAQFEWQIAKITTVFGDLWAGRLDRLNDDVQEFGRRCEAVGDRAASKLKPAYDAIGHLFADQQLLADACSKEGLASQETGFHFQHAVGLMAQVWAALYASRPEEAGWCLRRHWPALEASRMLDLIVIRFIALRLRAQASIAQAAEGTEARDQLLAQATKDAKRLAKDDFPFTRAMSDLTYAGIARVREERDESARLYKVAAERFDKAEMPLFAACARRWEGMQMGGEPGEKLVAAADATMKAAGIVRPDRVAQMWG